MPRGPLKFSMSRAELSIPLPHHSPDRKPHHCHPATQTRNLGVILKISLFHILPPILHQIQQIVPQALLVAPGSVCRLLLFRLWQPGGPRSQDGRERGRLPPSSAWSGELWPGVRGTAGKGRALHREASSGIMAEAGRRLLFTGPSGRPWWLSW